MGHYGMSCQYWKPPLRYMHAGDNQYLVGVGDWWWDNSDTCGQCLIVKNGNRTVNLVIADYCPECSPKQLDINQYASAALSPRERPQNFRNLTVYKGDCVWETRQPRIFLDQGSSMYNWYMIPLYFPRPALSVEVLGQKAYHDNYGRWVIGFKNVYPRAGYIHTVFIKFSDSVTYALPHIFTG